MEYYAYNYQGSAQVYQAPGGYTPYADPYQKPFLGYSKPTFGTYQSDYQGWQPQYSPKPLPQFPPYGASNATGSIDHIKHNQGQSYQADTYVQNENGYNKSPALTLQPWNNDPFLEILPSSFPEGTDGRLIESFNRIDRNGDGVIDDRELQAVLSSCGGQGFEMRTVHLLMYMFTCSNTRKIGPREFVPLYNSLQSRKAVFQRSDADKNGRINVAELRSALYSLGYTNISGPVLTLLISKFDKSKEGCSIGFDNFIECCLTVKGLTEKFKAKEDQYSGTATFTYEEFLLAVLPFIIA